MISAPALPPAILVVDDHPGVLGLLHRLLGEFVSDYEIVPFADGEAALAHARQRAVPLVFTDFLMPVMSGLELATALKAAAPGTRITMVTAYDTAELRQRASANGIDYFLPKPFPFEDLEAIVRAVLGEANPAQH